MRPELDLEALSRVPSAALLHKSLEGIDLAEQRVSDLVRLTAMFRARIDEGTAQAVEVSEPILNTYNRILPTRPLSLPALDPGSEIRRVSLLSPLFGRGPHLGAVSNFVSFLMSIQSLDQVDVIFSADVHPGVWAKAGREKQKDIFTRALNDSIALFFDSGTDPRAFRDKVNVVVAPEAEDLAEAIGDVVLRYEGSVRANQVRLCTQSIFRQRPVIGTVGTSVIKQVPDIDLLLTPTRRDLRHHEVHYLRPLPRFPDTPAALQFNPPAVGGKGLLSGYVNDKLARGVAQFGTSDWAALADLFRKFPEIHWHLFGAKDTEAVWRGFPAAFLEAFATRIKVSGMLDLADIFAGGFAFLALPGVGGSATTAKLALRAAVPVLVCRNDDRDISNMFPRPALHETIPELVALLSDWAEDPGKRAEYLKLQLANINDRADLKKKSAELGTLLAQATRLFYRRSSDPTPPAGSM